MSKLHSNAKDLTKQRFGRLVALNPTEKRCSSAVMWDCICDCRNKISVPGNKLSSGHTKSCGCLRRECILESNFRHGYRKHPLYTTWLNCKARCYYTKGMDYKNYGGRGITMCAEWRNDPTAFIEWALANGWKNGLTIDRRNNNGNYTPQNCRFSSRYTQSNNSRSNKLFIAYGPHGQIEISKHQAVFARKWGLSKGNINSCLHSRLLHHKNWKFEYLIK